MLLRDATGLVALQSDAASDGSSGTLWNLQDRLGSTIATTTGGGYVTDLADYSDFGIPTHTSQGFAGATGYTGEASSPTTGLNSYYARTYEPFTGSWLTPDTYRGTIADPGSQARYGYVGGNPSTFVDRNGNMRDDPGSGARHPSAAQAEAARLTAYGNAFNAAVKSGSAKVGNTCTGKACGSGNGPSCYVAICKSAASDRHEGSSTSSQQQKDNLQNAFAILAGVGIGIGITVAILALASCTVVTLGVCGGVAAGFAVGAFVAGGAASSLVTYSLSTGEKTPSGYLNSGLTGGAFGGITAGAGTVLKPVAQTLVSRLAAQAAAAGPAASATTGPALTTVGRWMSSAEYDLMVQTGNVQVGSGGVTYVSSPALPGPFASQAKPGTVYVEFDVPTSSLRPAGTPEIAQIPSPQNSLQTKIAILKGQPLQYPVPACNLVLVTTKC